MRTRKAARPLGFFIGIPPALLALQPEKHLDQRAKLNYAFPHNRFSLNKVFCKIVFLYHPNCVLIP
jgi:hypothetical protein